MREMQRNYWDGISGEYQRKMSISTDDFHYGPQIPGESALKILPELRRGMRALELGCGAAQNSIYIARRGVECVALDISAKRLAEAKRLAAKADVEIEFIQSAIEDFASKIEGTFDLIHSSHAFEFVEDPAGIITACVRVLKPGGMLAVSTVHPLYNGEWVENIDEDGKACGMGLFLENYFSPPDDVRRRDDGTVEVISRAYPVSAWFDWFRQAGLEVTAIAEPSEVAEGTPPYTSPEWADNEGELAAIPGTLIITGVKRGNKNRI